MDFDGPNFFMDLTLDQIEPKICDYDYNLIECTGFPPTPASSTNETDVSSPDNNNNNNGGSNNTMISPSGQCFGTSSHPINPSALADFTMDSFHQSASTLDQNAVGAFDSHGHGGSAGNYILFNEPNGSNSSAMAIFNDISISGTDTSEILNHLFEESLHMEGLTDSISSPQQQHHPHHLEIHRHHSPSGSSTGSFGSISTVSSPVPGTNDPNTFLGLVAANSTHASVSTPSSNDPPSPLSGHSMLTSGADSLSGELTMIRVPPPPQQHQQQHHSSPQVHSCNKTSKRSSRNRTLKNSGLPVLMDVKSAGTVVNSSKACFVLTDEVKKVLVKDGHFPQMPLPGEELTKEQQKIFRKAERKVRNKLSAQNSRLKRKEINENLLRNKAEQDDLIVTMTQQLKDKDAEIQKLKAIIERNMFNTDNQSPTLESNWNNVVRNNVMLTQAASNSIDFD